VRVFDFKEKSVGFLAHPRQFQTPLDLAVDSEGLIYVADGPQSVVNVFSPQGVLEKRIGSEDLFLNPAYLAFNENLGRLYVSDSKGHKIVVFDMEGNHLFSFGEKGGVPGKFFSPQGLAIRQSDDTLFVADRMNARIQVFTKDGEFVRTFGSRGDRWYQFEAPKDLAFDSDENLYIVDQRRSFFYTYSPEGDVLLVTGGDPTSGSPLSFASPVSIHIDENDRIYIADMILKRFSVWQYLSESYLAAHPITEQDLQRLKEAHVEQIQSEKKAQ
jgi:DNA-binding beta-propeller fold protein YncE